jgi:hypothetical protein
MLDSAKQILNIAPLKKLPEKERVARIVQARDLARKRFDSCRAPVSAPGGSLSPLHDLGARWMTKEATINRDALLHDSAEQDAVVKLVYDTETQTSQVCGPPAGDDALLLMLAKSPKAAEL